MNAAQAQESGFGPVVADELVLMAECLDLRQCAVLELGCGKARQARQLLQRFPQARVIGIEPHAALVAGNAQRPQAGLVVLQGRAEAVNLSAKTVQVAGQTLAYDALVFATGHLQDNRVVDLDWEMRVVQD